MTTRNPLSGIPLRAARWSATHPGRAIGAWFAFVFVAVGLAIAVPTVQTDDAADDGEHQQHQCRHGHEHLQCGVPGDAQASRRRRKGRGAHGVHSVRTRGSARWT